MQKHSVNLVIAREEESPHLVKLKKILPIVAAVSLCLFVIFFFSSLVYISRNREEFNSLKVQVDNLEKKISQQKNTEGIYTLTVARVKTIIDLQNGNKNFAKLLSEINKLQSSGVFFSQATVDKKNTVTVAMIASSSSVLDDFVATLVRAETAKLFSEIKSSGIVRDKNGAYLLSISVKPDPTLLQ